MKSDEITYNIEEGSQKLIDQKNNTIIRLAKMSWNGGPYKLDLRKWAFKGEELIPQKGFSFLTENGPHNLAEILVELGYGNTNKLQKYLDLRPKENAQKKDDIQTFQRNKLLEVIKK